MASKVSLKVMHSTAVCSTKISTITKWTGTMRNLRYQCMLWLPFRTIACGFWGFIANLNQVKLKFIAHGSIALFPSTRVLKKRAYNRSNDLHVTDKGNCKHQVCFIEKQKRSVALNNGKDVSVCRYKIDVLWMRVSLLNFFSKIILGRGMFDLGGVWTYVLQNWTFVVLPTELGGQTWAN